MRSFLSIIGQLICYHLLLVTAHDRKHNDRPNDLEYHLITFSSANHDKYAENVMRSAPLAGFNKTKHFKPADLDVDFLRSNTWAFGDITQKDWPPAGLEAYWIWKPYVILKYLSNYASYGDVVCYVDSRYEFSKYIMDWIIDLLSKPPHIAIPLHKPGEGLQKERWFSSGDIYILMNMNNEETKESLQAWAGFNCYRVSFTTIRFISEWLTYLQDPRIANGQYTLGEPRDPESKGHRQDQSVLSLMGKKWGANFFNISGQFYNCRGGGCHDT